MRTFKLPYADTHRFSPVVLDYLSGEAALAEMYAHPPTLQGLVQAARQRTFPAAHRTVLCNVLRDQYRGIDIAPEVRANLAALAQDDALTITTGHQLCLFTGPLYVPFKILNTVRAAAGLSAALNGRPVVPVFWMATEDHDRAEIDHAWVNGTKVQWPGAAAGAVGRMPLAGIEAVVDQAMALLGPGAGAGEVEELVRRCYRPEHTLAQATRLFVNGLFGRFGVVCLDGDDPDLKRLFVPVLQEELINQVTQRTVAYADAKLNGRYALQAHARDINLFHLRAGQRARITLAEDRYQVLDGGPSFDLDAVLQASEQRPQDFSPNVLLRPVYQETVLPNVAYIGGGGELAYWLQLKWLFLGMRVPMPVLLLRTSAAFLSSKHVDRWKGMGLQVKDLFAPLDPLKARVAADKASFRTDTDAETAALDAFYAGLLARATEADATLQGAVEARRLQALRGVESIRKGLVRAAKRQQDVALTRMDAVHAALFPGGGLQERKDNILPLLAARGTAYLDQLLEQLDPLDPRFTLVVED